MMTIRHLLLASCLVTSVATFSSCTPRYSHYQDGVSHNYPERAFLQQQADAYHDALRPSLNEEQDPLLDLSDCDCSPWERKTYETVDEWLERLHQELCSNSNRIRELDAQHLEISNEEQAHAQEIQSILRRNEQLRELASEATDNSHAEGAYRDVVLRGVPPFFVHLVKPGDTLFSISMKYYESGDMVSQIVSWNQGWIRQPDELVAGLGLVLFSKGHRGSVQQTVDQYIREVDNTPFEEEIR